MDAKIRDFILILNSHGIRTTGSCEGHINHGSPAPWVKVTPLSRTTSGETNYHHCGRRRTGDDQILRKSAQYLSEFYNARRVPRDARLVIEKAQFGFWIHNGGVGYSRWRKFVNESVVQIERGEKPKTYIDKEERARRSKRLYIYHKEIEIFTEFLRRKTSEE
jgi:hypothetical protein